MAKILNMDSNRNMEEKKGSNFIKDLQEVEMYRRKEAEKNPTVVIEFSWRFILLIVLGLSLIFLGPQILTVMIFLFGGFLVMSASRPVVGFLMNHKVGKGFAVSLTYIFGLLCIFGLVAVVILPFVDQIDELGKAVPGWINVLMSDFEDFNILGYTIDASMINNVINDWIERFTLFENFENIASTISSVFNSTALILAVIIFSIYLVLDHDNILELGLIRISSDARREMVKKLVLDV